MAQAALSYYPLPPYIRAPPNTTPHMLATDPRFLALQYHPTRTRILGIDLSKTSTGYALMEINEGRESHWVEHGTLSCPPGLDKDMYLAGDALVAALNPILDEASHDSNLTIAIEHPVFNLSRSEQQYYLYQRVIALFAQRGLNAVAYPAATLKAFIRLQAKKVVPPKVLKKEHIRAIYEQDVAPSNPLWFPRSDLIMSSDEMDALFLAIMGATWHQPWLYHLRLEKLAELTPDLWQALMDNLLWPADPDFLHNQWKADGPQPILGTLNLKESWAHSKSKWKAVRESLTTSRLLARESTITLNFNYLRALQWGIHWGLVTKPKGFPKLTDPTENLWGLTYAGKLVSFAPAKRTRMLCRPRSETVVSNI